jgi:hypothetical protein
VMVGASEPGVAASVSIGTFQIRKAPGDADSHPRGTNKLFLPYYQH